MSQDEPHPAALARQLLAAGDRSGALAVCEAWRAREPEDLDVAIIESEIRAAPESAPTARPPDASTAERYQRQGFLGEALLVLRGLPPEERKRPEISERIELLESFLDFKVPEDAPNLQLGAEAQIAQRRMTVAVLMYRELRETYPDDSQIRLRAELLERLVGAPPDPTSAAGDLNETVTDERPAGRRGEKDPALVDTLKKIEPPLPPRPGRERLAVHTMPALEVPRAVREDGAMRQSSVEWIDPLDDTQQLDRDELELPRPRKNPALARTQRSPSPMVVPADDEGRSVVSLPDEVTGVVERIRGRSSDFEAAEHAEGLGVLVRRIVVIG